MAQSYRSRYLSTLRNAERQFADLYGALANSIAAAVTRVAAADGTVARTKTFEVQRIAGDLVQRMFLGRNGQAQWAPFDTAPSGRLIPLSPYMRILWEAITAVVHLPVEQTAAQMTRRLPVDVLARLQQADRDPFQLVEQRVSEAIDPATLVRPNPLAKYDAPHEWVDPNGYRLSDRVWNTTAHTRRQIDLYLETAIREGRGALAMSRELEHFLRPDRTDLRTNKPYGNSASYDGMRLARTEIARAHQEATRASAAMNPFVGGMKWNLSASHPRVDICDALARGGPAGDGVYGIGEYPDRPHPNCLCWASQVPIAPTQSAAVLDALAADVRSARAEFVDLIGPVLVDEFTRMLLGENVQVGAVISRLVNDAELLL